MGSDRRDFIKKSLFAVLTLLGLGFLVPGIVTFSPLNNRKRDVVYVPLLPEEEVPRAGVKKSELVYSASGKERKARVFVVSSAERLTVFSATCSHLGCLVNYHRDKGEFICPCHGGRYDLSGRNIAGPPPAPLTELPVRIAGGMVMVGIALQEQERTE